MTKSIILGTVALTMTVFASSAMAQATGTPSMNAEVSGANEVFLQQGGPGYGGTGYGSNYANIDQGGSNNKIGKLNYSIDLSANALDPNSKNNETAYANSVLQVGYNNQLTATQDGSSNEILSRQFNIFAGAPTQTDRTTGGGSFQNGTQNVVNSTQNGTNGQVQFQQIGISNGATFNVYDGAKNTYAGAFQNGNNNGATINQYGSADNAYAAIVQTGNSNGATINQFANTNYAGVLQVGDGNGATISQYVNNVGGLVYQNGGGNSAELVQGHSLANAAVAQYGNGNYARVNQR